MHPGFWGFSKKISASSEHSAASPEHKVLVTCQKGSDRDMPMPLVGVLETLRVQVLTLDTVTVLQPRLMWTCVY